MQEQGLRKYWTRWLAKRGLCGWALERSTHWLVFVSPIGPNDPSGVGRALALDDAIKDAYRSHMDRIAEERRERVVEALSGLGQAREVQHGRR